VADPEVFLALSRACRNKKAPFYVGLTATASSFYGAQGREIDGFPLRYPNLQDDLTRMNVMNFEMEAAALFVLAQIRGLRAGAICATFASRPRNTFIDDEHRLPAEARCVEASLEAFVLLRTMDKERQAQNLPSWLPAEPLAS
jgi:uridine phosphorylase